MGKATARVNAGGRMAGAPPSWHRRVVALAYLATGPLIIAGLTSQALVRAVAGTYLPWAILLPLVSVWGCLFDGIFIGATRARELRNGMILSLAVFLLAAFVLMPLAGNNGLWAAFLLFMAARGICLGCFYPRIGASGVTGRRRWDSPNRARRAAGAHA